MSFPYSSTHDKTVQKNVLSDLSYVQQKIVEVRQGDAPLNAIDAIDRFSKRRILRRFSGNSYDDDRGLFEYGDYDDLYFWCDVQPKTRGKNQLEYLSKNRGGGEFVEGRIIVHYNPANISTLKENEGNSIFARIGGSYSLKGSDDVIDDEVDDGDPVSKKGVSDLLRYNGQWWKFISQSYFDADVEGSSNRIMMAECSLAKIDESDFSSVESDIKGEVLKYEIRK